MQKVLKTIWDEFTYGGHILSLGAVSIFLALSLIASLPVHLSFAILVYFGTLAVYKLDRAQDLKLDMTDVNLDHERISHFASRGKALTYEVLISIIITLIVVIFFGNPDSFIFLILLYILGLGYSVFFKKITAVVPGFKNFFVPLPYALIPFFYAVFIGSQINSVIIYFAIFVFLRLFSAVLFYDIKDTESDKETGISTLAVKLGKNGSLILSNVVNFLSVLLFLWFTIQGTFPQYSLIYVFLAFYFLIYSLMLKNSRHISRYSHIFCDGEFLLWYPLLLISKLLCN